MIRRVSPMDLRRSSGSSLLLVMIGISAAFLVAYFATQSVLSQNATFAHYALMSEVEDLNHYFARAVDCATTFSPLPAVCSTVAGGPIAIKIFPNLVHGSGATTTLVAASPTGSRIVRYSSFKVRASCKLVAGIKTLRVEFNRVSSDDKWPLLDPVTHRLFDGQPLSPTFRLGDPMPGWKSVIQGVNVCQSYLN